jgi:hypothetical protein
MKANLIINLFDFDEFIFFFRFGSSIFFKCLQMNFSILIFILKTICIVNRSFIATVLILEWLPTGIAPKSNDLFIAPPVIVLSMQIYA